MISLALFLKLMIAHFVVDYPLQGDFLSRAKNHRQPIPGVPFYQALVAHAAMHAGAVWLLTGSLFFGSIEFVLHAGIDYAKSDGRLSFNGDQALHMLCKVGYVLAIGGV